jgi:hypothetical protein
MDIKPVFLVEKACRLVPERARLTTVFCASGHIVAFYQDIFIILYSRSFSFGWKTVTILIFIGPESWIKYVSSEE